MFGARVVNDLGRVVIAHLARIGGIESEHLCDSTQAPTRGSLSTATHTANHSCPPAATTESVYQPSEKVLTLPRRSLRDRISCRVVKLIVRRSRKMLGSCFVYCAVVELMFFRAG